MKKLTVTRGFTIVEISVVVVVIAILATITVIGYSSWRLHTVETAVKSDLKTYASTMEALRNSHNGYPTVTPITFEPSENITSTLDDRSNTQQFCVTATSGEASFYIANNVKEPTQGSCAANWL